MYPEDEDEDQQQNYEYEKAPKRRRRGRPVFDGDAVALKVQGLPRPVLLAAFVAVVALIAFIVFTGTESDKSDSVEPASKTTSVGSDTSTEPTSTPSAAEAPEEAPATEPTNPSTVEPVVEPDQELLPLPASSIKAGKEVIATGLTALTKASWAEQSTLFSPEVLAAFTGPAEAYMPVAGEVTMGRVRMLLADAVSVEATIGDVAYVVTVIKADGTWLIQGIDLLNDSAISAGE